jgi:hypothetical protein
MQAHFNLTGIDWRAGAPSGGRNRRPLLLNRAAGGLPQAPKSRLAGKIKTMAANGTALASS